MVIHGMQKFMNMAKSKETKICGYDALYSKGKKFERMEIDITDFYNGYGELSDINSFFNLISYLKKDKWTNVGVSKSEYYGVFDYILEVIKEIK